MTTHHPSVKFMECLQYAAQKHKNQRRLDKEQTPYINHPINVATILAVEAGVEDEDVLCGALLHDTVEDTDATFEEIQGKFGGIICSLVREVTDDKSLEKQRRKQLQIENASNKSHNAKLIALADKLDNLRDLLRNLPTGWTEERRDQYFVWAKKVVDNLRGANVQMEVLLDDIFKQKNLISI